MVSLGPLDSVGLADAAALVDVVVEVDVEVDVVVLVSVFEPQPTSATLSDMAARPAVATAVIFLLGRTFSFLWWPTASDGKIRLVSLVRGNGFATRMPRNEYRFPT